MSKRRSYFRGRSRKRENRPATPVPADPDSTDAGKYWHCRQCGFICNIERDLRQESNTDGTILEFYQLSSDPSNQPSSFDSPQVKLVLRGGLKLFKTFGVVRPNLTQQSRAGCPFCGSFNWK